MVREFCLVFSNFCSLSNLFFLSITSDYISYRPPEDPIHVARASTKVQQILIDIIKQVNTYKSHVPPITVKDLWPFSYSLEVTSKPVPLHADDGMFDSNSGVQSLTTTSSGGNSESDSQYENIQRPTTPGSSRISNRMSYFGKF